MIQIKRVYEQAENNDGYRVLVDRLWPRGMKKSEVSADEWLKDIAPSASLRQWFNHDPAKWKEFKKRYKAELKNNEATKRLKQIIKEQPVVTLVYAAKDTIHNQAAVLQHLYTFED
ncbi:DUF488 domain-containing protein [Haoranjiania flava]|uniref:DUF488 domain-containing protein n=1 Tax=Haoranjiania flava TaxID=1856322 RepID=A0AAE3IN63_9BACT|nr:DUF488 domain-containing protein [Haoranjiania flava]MCU7695073.1 DUF488 domain-containing protein [Haoranjiania flava]